MTRFEDAINGSLNPDMDLSDFFNEETLLESGQLLTHHDKASCSGNCCLHGTSTFESCILPRQWRTDRRILEHVCRHGVGHPCAAGVAYAAMLDYTAVVDGVHDCCEDGCCVQLGGTDAAQAALTTPVLMLSSLYAMAVRQSGDIAALKVHVDALRESRDTQQQRIYQLRSTQGAIFIGLMVLAALITVVAYTVNG